jgi:Zn-dependent membrane protease YugP
MQAILITSAVLILVFGIIMIFSGEFILCGIAVFIAVILFTLEKILMNQQIMEIKINKLYAKICEDSEENEKKD